MRVVAQTVLKCDSFSTLQARCEAEIYGTICYGRGLKNCKSPRLFGIDLMVHFKWLRFHTKSVRADTFYANSPTSLLLQPTFLNTGSTPFHLHYLGLGLEEHFMAVQEACCSILRRTVMEEGTSGLHTGLTSRIIKTQSGQYCLVTLSIRMRSISFGGKWGKSRFNKFTNLKGCEMFREYLTANLLLLHVEHLAALLDTHGRN